MKKILILFMCALIATSCDRELESEGIAAGTIAFPSVLVLGPSQITIVAGESFDDPGAQAFLGTDEISEQLVVTSDVDVNVPGVYSIVYSVSTVNELGDESSSSGSRTILVTSEDISAIDLSGNYLRNGDPSNPVVTATKLGTGTYSFPNLFGSGTVVSGFTWYHTGGTNIEAPIQNSQFGRLFAYGSLTSDGFEYSIEFLDPPNDGLILSRTFVKQ